MHHFDHYKANEPILTESEDRQSFCYANPCSHYPSLISTATMISTAAMAFMGMDHHMKF